MILNEAVFTNKTLIFPAKLRSDLIRMSVTKDLGYLEVFFDKLFDIIIRSKLYRFIKPLRCTVIRVTERAFKLPFDDKFLALTFHHHRFDTLTTGNFSTAYQINGFSIFKIEEVLADWALEL